MVDGAATPPGEAVAPLGVEARPVEASTPVASKSPVDFGTPPPAAAAAAAAAASSGTPPAAAAAAAS